MSGKIEALLRGLGQGASLGWGDEAIPYVTRGIEGVFGGGPKDPEGIERNYAAGDRYADQTAGERRDNEEARTKYPASYYTGQIAGGLPSSVAMSGIGAGPANPLLARVAAGGLTGGIRGGVEGAGHAEEGSRLDGAARSAGPAALLGAAGAAAPAAGEAIKNIFKGGPPSAGGLVPALATVGTGASKNAGSASSAGSRAASVGGPILNQATITKPPPKGPRGGATAKEAPASEHTTTTRAIPPPKGYGQVTIPKQKMPDMSWNEANRTAQAADIAHGEKTLAELQPAKTAADAAAMPQARPTEIGKLMTRPEIPSLPPQHAKLQPPEIPEFQAKYHPDLPTIPPSAISADAKIAQGMEQLRPQTMPPSSFTQEGTPTIPPGAISSEAQALPGLEKSRAGMLPPATEEALDQSLISGAPKDADIPLEFSGKYKTDWGPKHGEKFGYSEGDAPLATDNDEIAHWSAQDDAAFEARGKQTPAWLKRQRGEADRPGQEMLDAEKYNYSGSQDLNTTPAEYLRKPRNTFGYDEFPEGHPQAGDGKTAPAGDLGEPSEFGEFKLDSKPRSSAGQPKSAKVSDLMKRKTKRTRDDD